MLLAEVQFLAQGPRCFPPFLLPSQLSHPHPPQLRIIALDDFDCNRKTDILLCWFSSYWLQPSFLTCQVILKFWMLFFLMSATPCSFLNLIHYLYFSGSLGASAIFWIWRQKADLEPMELFKLHSLEHLKLPVLILGIVQLSSVLQYNPRKFCIWLSLSTCILKHLPSSKLNCCPAL